MSAREYLALVQEQSFGTPVTTPATGTSRHYIRLSQANAFTGLMTPVIANIPTGDGYNSPDCFYADTYNFEGTIQGELYPSLTDFVLKWATTQVNTGRTTPWVTTDAAFVMPPGDLASISAYRGVREYADFKRRRGSGLKARSLALSASRQDPIWRWNAPFVGIRDDTNAAGVVAAPLVAEIPDPVASDYSCGPWMFSHLAGGLKIGTQRTMFDGVTVTFTNVLEPLGSESPHPQVIRFGGRTITIQVGLYRKPAPDDLASFRALAGLDTQLVLTNGVKILTLNFGANTRWTELTEDTPIGGNYMWRGTLTVGRDPATNTDFSYTLADV